MKKILNVIGGLNIGGAENNAMNILRFLDKEKYQYEFLVFSEGEDDYELEAKDLGAIIYRLPEPKKNYLDFIRKFHKLLQSGNYDVIHVNTLWNSGILLSLAGQVGVPIRICHSHSTESSAVENATYKVYKAIMKYLINKCSTHKIACGKDAGFYLYGKKVFLKEGKVIYNGIDLAKFKFNESLREEWRKKLGIEENNIVIGHTGRFAPVKNHKFIVDRMKNLVKENNAYKLVLVGDGPDFFSIKDMIKNSGIENYCIMLGKRQDIGEILNAFDIFLFPSFFEGFPVSLIEAEANSLPCIISDTVTFEADLTDNCHYLSLENSSLWEELIEEISLSSNRDIEDIYKIEDNFDVYKVAEEWQNIYSI